MRSAFSSFAFTALFVAVSIVVLRAEAADFWLSSFKNRVVSTPTVDGIDIGARTALFTSSVALFVGAFVLVLALLELGRRAVSDSIWRAIEALSIAGSSLWLAHAYAIDTEPTIVLVIAVQLAILSIGLFDQWVLRRGAHPDTAAYLATLGIAAAGVVILVTDLVDFVARRDVPWAQWHIGVAMVALHVLVRAFSWRRDAERGLRALNAVGGGLLLFASIPFISFLRDEIYLTLNNHGVLTVEPRTVEYVLIGFLALFVVVRIFRDLRRQDPPSLTARVGRFGLPLFLFGIASIAYYFPLHPLPDKLFEAANPGLFVQQFFDFGRIPYLETFNAHGFSDSFWSFVFPLLQGNRDEVTGFYEFLNRAIGAVLVYWLLRRATGNPYLACFAVLFAPFYVDVFPVYCELAIASLFVLERVLAKPSAIRIAAFAMYTVGVFHWRLDMGAANLIASAGVVAVTWLTSSRSRPRWRDLLVGGTACGFVYGVVFLGLAWYRGVDPLHVVQSLQHIVSSSQGFGQAVAREFGPDVRWHLFVLPIAVLSIAAISIFLRATTQSPTRERAFLMLFLAYGAFYYFANFQRGLVRHTWIEPGNVYVLSFGFVVLALSPYLRASGSERSRWIAFLGIATVLAGSFGLQGPIPASAAKYKNLWQKTIAHRIEWPHVQFAPFLIDRSPSSPSLEKHHYGAARRFIASNLTPDQTFLDLTMSPMLYVVLHRRSPHYLNHLYLAHDEWLQKNEIPEFEENDVPVVFTWMEEDLAKFDGEVANQHNFGDTVHNSVRQWVFHEWLNRHYEPWCVVQRWQVWRRKNWLAPTHPFGVDAAELAKAQPTTRGGGVSLRSVDGTKPVAPLEPGTVTYLEIDGNATKAAQIDVTLTFDDAAGQRGELRRRLDVTPGSAPRYWTLPFDLEAKSLHSVDVTSASGFEFSSVELETVVALDYSTVLDRARLRICPTLGNAAWLWATGDDRKAITRPVLRELRKQQSPAQSQNAVRYFFDPLDDPLESCYVALRIRRSTPNAQIAGVVWGIDDRAIGRMNFQTVGDGPQDYLVRVSSQFSWSRRRCNWISVVTTGENEIEVLDAKILKGD